MFLLEVPIQVSLDPVGWSFAKHFSHVGTLFCNALVGSKGYGGSIWEESGK